MCLIGFSWKNHPHYKLILLANRDEFYERKTAAAHFWEEAPHILAGKDLEGGGTWLGINKQGLFTALTNYRDIENLKEDAPSRGILTLDFLQSEISPVDYASLLVPHKDKYNGFNILLGDLNTLCYLSNYDPEIKIIAPGLYGLSNHLLDSDWYKVKRLKEKMAAELSEYEPNADRLLDLIRDLEIPPDEQVQQTGLSLEKERMLSPLFIQSPHYGTHSTIVLLIDYEHNIQFTERVYSNDYRDAEQQTFTFQVNQEETI